MRFIISTVITFGILVLASTAFVATCVPTGLCIIAISGMNRPEPGVIVACIAGAVAALFVIYHLGGHLWPRKD